MNKNELVSAVAETANLTKKDALASIDALVETITETLSNGDEVNIVGLGKFTTIEKAARVCRNPQTGESVEVDAKISPKFKASKPLKDALN